MENYRFLVRERLAAFREWVESRPPRRVALVLFACLVVGLTVIIGTAYLPWPRGFEEGKSAPRTVVATKTVSVVDNEATEELRQQVAQLVEPAYAQDPQALTKALSDLQEFFRIVASLRQEVAAGLEEQEALARLRMAAPDTLSTESARYLLFASPTTYDLVQRQTTGVLKPIYAGEITSAGLEETRRDLRKLVNNLNSSADVATVIYEIAAGFVRPNLVVDEERTLARRQAAMEEVAPVLITVPRGEQVIKEGEVVSAQDILVLEALGVTHTRSGWQVWLGIFFLCALEATVFFLLVRRFHKNTGVTNVMLLVLVALVLGFTVVARLLIIHPLSPYLIPAAGLGMVVAIILDARTAFLSVTLLAANIGLLTDLEMRYSLVAIIVGALAVYLVSRVVQRATLLGAGALIMVIAAFTVFSVELFQEAGTAALQTALWGLGQGVLAWMLTVLLLLILDLVFNLSTPLRLLELANPAQPLLKKLLQVAPGTYNHSIFMGNLAEAAAEAIGADPLLARVGAYYHDIGKIVRPEYFVENQIYVDNPHDRLSPNLSKLAIVAHVRDGEQLAKLHGLPEPVIEIIRQHHGTSVLSYFYHKAQESSPEPVDEESYRYEEEKPHSREAAIIMLADGVEAAARALSNPTRRKIQGVIEEVFKQRIEDGQLDESALTLGDIQKIKEAFEVTLRGMVGHRIKYPEKNGQQGRSVESVDGRVSANSANGTRAPIAPPDPGTSTSSRSRIPPSAATLRTRKKRAAAGEAATGESGSDKTGTVTSGGA